MTCDIFQADTCFCDEFVAFYEEVTSQVMILFNQVTAVLSRFNATTILLFFLYLLNIALFRQEVAINITEFFQMIYPITNTYFCIRMLTKYLPQLYMYNKITDALFRVTAALYIMHDYTNDIPGVQSYDEYF